MFDFIVTAYSMLWRVCLLSRKLFKIVKLSKITELYSFLFLASTLLDFFTTKS